HQDLVLTRVRQEAVAEPLLQSRDAFGIIRPERSQELEPFSRRVGIQVEIEIESIGAEEPRSRRDDGACDLHRVLALLMEGMQGNPSREMHQSVADRQDFGRVEGFRLTQPGGSLGPAGQDRQTLEREHRVGHDRAGHLSGFRPRTLGAVSLPALDGNLVEPIELPLDRLREPGLQLRVRQHAVCALEPALPLATVETERGSSLMLESPEVEPRQPVRVIGGLVDWALILAIGRWRVLKLPARAIRGFRGWRVDLGAIIDRSLNS